MKDEKQLRDEARRWAIGNGVEPEFTKWADEALDKVIALRMFDFFRLGAEAADETLDLFNQITNNQEEELTNNLRFLLSHLVSGIAVKLLHKDDDLNPAVHEDKARICEALVPVLQMTRNYHDLVSLRYEKPGDYTEVVVGTYANGTELTAHVSMDSGEAMIRDIMRQI